AMNALYRPGPLAYIPNYIKRKHGLEPIVYELEGMDEFLQETYGITVYQEQVMRLSQKLANFTKGDADVLRKAMGKKQKDVLDKMKSKFLDGCKANGHDTAVAEKVWTDWEAFASYAFNKSHSTCYAYVAFQTAYIKANYPAEFMASVLTHNMGNIESVTFFMEECKRMGLTVLGPDVNESIGDFSVNEKGEIRFGMAAIKGVGANVVDAIVEERANGKYSSVFDIARRLDTKAVNKKSLEALAQAGAFDSFEEVHRAMFFVPDMKDGLTLTEKIIRYGNSLNSMTDTSQVNMFDDTDDNEIAEPALPVINRWEPLDQLAKEKEVVGFYISGHPLDMFKYEMKHACRNTLSELADLKPLVGKEMGVAGIITFAEERISQKNGNPWGKFRLEDYGGSFEFVMFGEDYMKFRMYFSQNQFVYVKGRIQARFGQADNLEFKVTKMGLLSELMQQAFKHLQIKISSANLDETALNTITDLLSKNSNDGKSSYEIIVDDPAENTHVKLQSRVNKLSITKDLLDEFEKMHYVESSLS
ncbi:MAG TPA: OB-fold nucleic acid binding domain-containing protein, partial [Bacteroidia bacterium]